MSILPPPLPRSRLAVGIDVSFNNGIVDWGGAWADGVRFASIRGGQGGDWIDPRLMENWSGARKIGILRKLYLVWDQRRGAGGREHLENLRRVLRIVRGDLGEMRGVIDLELEPVDWGEVRILADGMEEIWGDPPELYSGGWFLNRHFVPKWARDLDHWLTGYNEQGPDLPSAYTPSVVEWQQTSSWLVPWSGNGRIDRDFWMGDRLDLWRYAHMAGQVVDVDPLLDWLAQNRRDENPPPPPPDEWTSYLVLVAGNLRVGPGVSETVVRLLDVGEIVEHDGEIVMVGDEKWWHLRTAQGELGYLWNPSYKLDPILE